MIFEFDWEWCMKMGSWPTVGVQGQMVNYNMKKWVIQEQGV